MSLNLYNTYYLRMYFFFFCNLLLKSAFSTFFVFSEGKIHTDDIEVSKTPIKNCHIIILL